MSEISEAELDPSIKPVWLKAMAAVQKKNFPYAITLLQQVIKQSPEFLNARQLLRQCEGQATGGPKKKATFFGMKTGGGLGTMKLAGQVKKDPRAALTAIETELAKEPYSPELNDLLFEAFVALGWTESAAFALETVRRGDPSQLKPLHKLAEFYLTHGQSMKAAEVYRDIIKHHPTDSVAIKGEKDATARASMEKQKWGEGANMRDLMRNKDEFEELEKQSRSGLTRDQLEERRDELMAAYAENQNDFKVVKDLASVFERLEDWDQAHAYYEWAFSLSHGDTALQTKAASMAARSREQSLRELEAEAEKNPDDPEIQAKLVALRQERTQQAVEEAQQRVDQNPTDPTLRFELGRALYALGDFSAAIPQLQQAKRNPHIQSKVLLLLGQTFKAKGMPDMGVKQLETALSDLTAMDATKKEILYEKGVLHQEMGDKEAAIECFKEIYEVDYGYRDVAQRVESSYGD